LLGGRLAKARKKAGDCDEFSLSERRREEELRDELRARLVGEERRGATCGEVATASRWPARIRITLIRSGSTRGPNLAEFKWISRR